MLSTYIFRGSIPLALNDTWSNSVHQRAVSTGKAKDTTFTSADKSPHIFIPVPNLKTNQEIRISIIFPSVYQALIKMFAGPRFIIFLRLILDRLRGRSGSTARVSSMRFQERTLAFYFTLHETLSSANCSRMQCFSWLSVSRICNKTKKPSAIQVLFDINGTNEGNSSHWICRSVCAIYFEIHSRRILELQARKRVENFLL